jgi:Helix-turn-helix domain
MAAGKKPFNKPALGERFNPYGLFRGLFIPEQIAGHSGLKPGAKLIYGIIGRYKGQDRECFVGIARFATESGLSEKVARGCLWQLQEQRFIEIEERRGQSSIYHFLWHSVFETENGKKWQTAPLPKRAGVDVGNSIELQPGYDGHTPAENRRGTPAQMGTAPLAKRAGDPCPNGQANTVTEYSQVQQSSENTQLGAPSAPASASLSSLNSILASAASGLPADEPQKPRLAARPMVAADPTPKTNGKPRKAEAAANPAAGSGTPATVTPKPSPERPQANPPWTAQELAIVRRALQTYMKEAPRAGFERSCELRARGATAKEVCDLLIEKHSNPKFRPGRKYGPGRKDGEDTAWNWFLTLIGNELDYPHLPEPSASVSTALPKEQFASITAALDGDEATSFDGEF